MTKRITKNNEEQSLDMKKDPTGSMHIVAVLVAIVVVTVAFVGFQVAQTSRKDDKKTETKTNAPTPTNTAGKKQIKITVAESGKKIIGNGLADPTIAATSSGYRMYVNRQSGGPGGYLTYTSNNGVDWTKEKDVIISGAATGRAVQFPDGIRFYYPGMQPINPSDPPADMFSSFATDGVTFKKEGVALKPRTGYYVEGPTVFQLADKSWRMYFNENSVASGNQRDGEIWGASSKDGLTWVRDEKVTLKDEENTGQPWKQALHPFVLTNPKGGYIMFYNTHSEIYAATSNDGKNWDKLGKIGVHGADIDGYFQKDGSIRIYYGDFSPQTGGLLYTGVLKVE